MNIPTIAIIATPVNATVLMQYVFNLGYTLLFSTDVSATKTVELTLVCIENSDILLPYSPWLAWNRTDDLRMIPEAYQAGARAVFPKETPLEVIVDSIKRVMGELIQNHFIPQKSRQRTYRRGELILLEANAVLFIEDGILATTMIHQDGTEVLLGLSGKGQIAVAHPDDDCHVQIIAHTAAKVQIEPWETAVNHPDFVLKMKERLQQMEGWAAMQARPSLSQRVLGILGLLAGRFGVVYEQNILIDVRITHTQLALAVGSNRTSVTRVLSELRDTGKIKIISVQGEDRYCLCNINLVESHQ